MGIMSWDLGDGFSIPPVVRAPRITIRCEYPDGSSPPDEVSFRLSPSYGIHSAREAHDWFLLMMRSHDEFVVETDREAQWPVPFWTETVRWVVVGVPLRNLHSSAT